LSTASALLGAIFSVSLFHSLIHQRRLGNSITLKGIVACDL
jgi:hypothetical protein